MTELYEQAIEKWGTRPQLRMAQEECAELISAINRLLRDRTDIYPVAEEVADVLIMAEQTRIIVGSGLVDRIKKEKLDRLKHRIERVE